MFGQLNKTEIKQCLSRSINDDPLFISPILETSQIGDSSVDLRIGQSFLIQKPSRNSVLDPYELSIRRYSNQNIQEDYDLIHIPYGSYFTLHAGQSVSIGSLEYIGLPKDLSGLVTLRLSSSSIPVSSNPALIQPGYRGVIVLNLQNNGIRPFLLYPGMRFAQINFTWLARTEMPLNDSRYFATVLPQPGRIQEDSEMRFLGPVTRPLIIGVVSEISSGRSTSLSYLQKNYGFPAFSLTTLLKNIAREEGVSFERSSLQKFGNALRKKYGNAFLAEQLRSSRVWIENKHPVVLVDAFKNLAEYEEFRKQEHFYFLGITAPEANRKNWNKIRRETGARNEIQTFFAIDEQDLGTKESNSSNSQQVSHLFSKTDEIIDNDGSIEDLYKKLDEMVKNAKKKGYR